MNKAQKATDMLAQSITMMEHLKKFSKIWY